MGDQGEAEGDGAVEQGHRRRPRRVRLTSPSAAGAGWGWAGVASSPTDGGRLRSGMRAHFACAAPERHLSARMRSSV